MANNAFVVPELADKGCWMDMRHLEGGYGWRGDMDLGNIRKIVIHHTVSSQFQNAEREFVNVWQHRRYGGTAYHFLISSEIKNGLAVVGYMGDVGSVRAHAINDKGLDGIPATYGNHYSIGIAFVGDHTKKLPSKEMLASAKLLIRQIVERDNRFSSIPRGDYSNVIGHGHWDYTWCPDGVQGTTLIPMILSASINTTPPPSPPNNNNNSNNSNTMDPKIKPIMDAANPNVQKALLWADQLVRKANQNPLGSTPAQPIFTNTSPENLNRLLNGATFLVLLEKYHYALRSVIMSDIEETIQKSVKESFNKADVIDIIRKKLLG